MEYLEQAWAWYAGPPLLDVICGTAALLLLMGILVWWAHSLYRWFRRRPKDVVAREADFVREWQNATRGPQPDGSTPDYATVALWECDYPAEPEPGIDLRISNSNVPEIVAKPPYAGSKPDPLDRGATMKDVLAVKNEAFQVGLEFACRLGEMERRIDAHDEWLGRPKGTSRGDYQAPKRDPRINPVVGDVVDRDLVAGCLRLVVGIGGTGSNPYVEWAPMMGGLQDSRTRDALSDWRDATAGAKIIKRGDE